jgi:hypothetical protein
MSVVCFGKADDDHQDVDGVLRVGSFLELGDLLLSEER